MCIRDRVLLQSPFDLEFVLFSVANFNSSYKVHVGLFYRPPSSPTVVLDLLHSCLQDANVCSFSNFVLLGDFNVNVSHPLLSNLCDLLDCFSLVQVVSEPTYTSPTGTTSLIDLVLISNSSMLSSCAVVPPLGTSDHKGVQLSLKWRTSNPRRTKPRKVWRYNQADFESANSILSSVDWADLLSQLDDIDQVWEKWKDKFMSVMEQCIPQATLSDRRNLPWLDRKLTKSMRARNLAYKRAKRTMNPNHWSVYKKKRNNVANNLKHAKKKYFAHLSPSNTNHSGKQ